MMLKLFPPRYHCYPPSLRYCGRAAVLRALCSNNILIMIKQPVYCEQCFQGFNFNYLFITSVCLLIVSHVVSAFYWGICLKNGKQVVEECHLIWPIKSWWVEILGSSMSRRPVCCEIKTAQVPSFRPHFPSNSPFLPPCWGQHCLGGRWDASPWGLARPWSREHGPGLDGQWCQDYR